MLTLLKLVPFKDWVYLGFILLIIGTFGWYTLHEREIGEAKCEARVAAAQAKADAAAKDMQAKLDAAASRDAALQAALTEAKPVLPAITLPASCRYTQSQIDALRKVLQ